MRKKMVTALAVMFVVLFVVGCPIALTISSVSPANGAVNVALNSIIQATFNDVLDPFTVVAANFIVTQDGNHVAINPPLMAGPVVTIIPAENLLPGRLYEVRVTTGIKGINGNVMAAPFIWSFTTASIVDTTPPSVVSVSPANGTTAAVNSTVSVTFSEAVDQASVVISLLNTGTGAWVSGITTVNGMVANFQPSANLAFNSHFQATVQSARDLAGNVMAAPYVWEFGTFSTLTFPLASLVFIPSKSPTIATFNPVTGEANVLKEGNHYSVSLSGAPVDVIEGESYTVRSTCDFEQAEKPIQVELKKRVNPTGAYASKEAYCVNGVIEVVLTPKQTDYDARVSYNIGKTARKIKIGPIEVLK